MCIVNLSVVCGTTWPERYETLKELIGITLNIIITWIIKGLFEPLWSFDQEMLLCTCIL